MTEPEMIDMLEAHIERLEEIKYDMSMTRGFFDVGEWLLAFEGIWVVNDQLANILDANEVSALEKYFDIVMAGITWNKLENDQRY